MHSCSFKIDPDHRNPRWLTCMSKKRTFLDMYQFETYINGFLDLEYPNFDTKHGFLSSVEAEIISFCQRRQPFAFSAFYVKPLTFEGGSPSKFDKWDLETWLKKRVSFICFVTMFNTILFYACHIRQIKCNFST